MVRQINFLTFFNLCMIYVNIHAKVAGLLCHKTLLIKMQKTNNRQSVFEVFNT
jgi:hypothetical protein